MEIEEKLSFKNVFAYLCFENITKFIPKLWKKPFLFDSLNNKQRGIIYKYLGNMLKIVNTDHNMYCARMRKQWTDFLEKAPTELVGFRYLGQECFEQNVSVDFFDITYDEIAPVNCGMDDWKEMFVTRSFLYLKKTYLLLIRTRHYKKKAVVYRRKMTWHIWAIQNFLVTGYVPPKIPNYI